MNYFEEQEQAISEDVYRQLMKMMEAVPEDRRDGLYIYVHLDKEVGINGLVFVYIFATNLIYDIIALTD